MNAVVEHRDQLPQQSDSAALLAVIERATLNPKINIEKMERLMAMHRQIAAQRSEDAFNINMALAQSEMIPIATNADNPQTHSRYANYAQLDRALRPIYTKHGFALSFDEADSPKVDHIRLLCYVTNSGHTRIYHRDICADGKGAKGGDVMTRTHASGAAQSYGMRYLLKAIFNVAVGEEDKDGNESGDEDPVYITEVQAANMQALLTEINANVPMFLQWIKAESIAKILASDYKEAMDAIEERRRRG